MSLDNPYDEATAKQVLYEVFEKEEYKDGMDYINLIDKPVIVDLGAYIGITPLYFAQKEDAKIYAVEPHPDSYKSLVLNTKHNKNIIPINNSIGFKEHDQFIYQDDKHIGMSMYERNKTIKFPIHTITIKQLFDKYKIEHIDLLKIDVEDAEFEIFLSDAFDEVKDKIDFIVGEAHNDEMPYQGVKTILEGRGFKVEFLPIDNVITKYVFKFDDKIKEVNLPLQTLFHAFRL